MFGSARSFLHANRVGSRFTPQLSSSVGHRRRAAANVARIPRTGRKTAVLTVYQTVARGHSTLPKPVAVRVAGPDLLPPVALEVGAFLTCRAPAAEAHRPVSCRSSYKRGSSPCSRAALPAPVIPAGGRDSVHGMGRRPRASREEPVDPALPPPFRPQVIGGCRHTQFRRWAASSPVGRFPK